MKLLNQRMSNFYDLPVKKQRELLLKAAKKANKEQKALEDHYLKLLEQS